MNIERNNREKHKLPKDIGENFAPYLTSIDSDPLRVIGVGRMYLKEIEGVFSQEALARLTELHDRIETHAAPNVIEQKQKETINVLKKETKPDFLTALGAYVGIYQHMAWEGDHEPRNEALHQEVEAFLRKHRDKVWQLFDQKGKNAQERAMAYVGSLRYGKEGEREGLQFGYEETNDSRNRSTKFDREEGIDSLPRHKTEWQWI